MDAAEAAGRAIEGESNFFLFFRYTVGAMDQMTHTNSLPSLPIGRGAGRGVGGLSNPVNRQN